jgi:hypothetical protein
VKLPGTRSGASHKKLRWHASCYTTRIIISTAKNPKPIVVDGIWSFGFWNAWGRVENEIKAPKQTTKKNRDKLEQVKKARLAEWKIKLVWLQTGQGHEHSRKPKSRAGESRP